MAITNIQIPSFSTLAAANYSCDAYGEYAFGECAPAGTTPAGEGLADTGWNILLPIALALAIIIASGILLVKRWRRGRSTASAR